jgi:hypothetical protein
MVVVAEYIPTELSTGVDRGSCAGIVRFLSMVRARLSTHSAFGDGPGTT